MKHVRRMTNAAGFHGTTPSIIPTLLCEAIAESAATKASRPTM